MTVPGRRAAATALLALLAVLTSAPAAPAGAATTALPSRVSRDVATALGLAAPSYARVDRSTNTVGTRCIAGPSAEPLVYRDDRVVLRVDPVKVDVRARVGEALRDIGSSATVGTPQVIALPQTPPAAPLLPVVWVALSGGEGQVDVVRLARLLTTRGLRAAPDALLSPTGPVGMWPDGMPVPGSPRKAPRPDPALGAGTEVWAYDTGLPTDTRSWAPRLSRYSARDVEHPDVVQPLKDVADIYSVGHTLAIGGVLETVAPGAEVRALRITGGDGVATDVSAAQRMAETLQATAAWPEVIVNSFGAPACDGPLPGTELVPLGLQGVAEAIDRRGGTVVVAAAGNRSTQRRFYPAAFATSPATDAVLSVGALDATADGDGDAWSSASRTAPRAGFSNSGSWVRAWAPGTALVTRHVTGLSFEGSPVLQGSAVISGTSFATPYVAGLIVEQVARGSGTGPLDPRAALTALLASGRPCQSGVALALVDMTTARADTRSTAPLQC